MTTPTAASLRTRRDTAAVHPPTAGAHRLPPRALLHLIDITLAVLREIITPIVRFVHSVSDMYAEVVEPEHLQSYIHVALCVNCDAPRMFDKNGYCETCCADSAFHRPGYKRGAINVKGTSRRRVVRIQTARTPQTAPVLRQVRGRRP